MRRTENKIGMNHLNSLQLSEYRSLLRILRPAFSEGEIARIKQVIRFLHQSVSEKSEDLVEKSFNQALSVASVVAGDIGLGTHSVIAALLYKAAELHIVSEHDIKNLGGDKCAELVEGLIRISSFEMQPSAGQAENFRQLLLALAADIRIILIKLAERLVVMRSMDKEDLPFRLRLAWEAFNLYAPLAHRLGLYNLKSEMEDIAMKHSDPENYFLIEQRLRETSRKRTRLIREFITPIENELTAQGFRYEIKSRTKSVWSIWNKMKKQQVSFDEIYDVFAIRIIIDSEPKNEKSDCWRVYSIVTDLYQPNPQRLRDWISVPKSNGYESLHTTVIGPGGTWVEVQIRTRRMDDIAEKGFAAHWKYKGVRDDNSLDQWLGKVRELLEMPAADASEILDELQRNPLNEEVFVFTPKGDLRKFPQGATVLDFAFDIHTQVGCSCMGAKVNGKNVPIRYVLRNGDKVEILQGKSQKPKPDWLDFVVTTKAKTRIRQYLKEEVVREAEHGKELLMRRMKNWKVDYNDENIRKLLDHYKLKTSSDLFYRISVHEIDLAEVKNILTRREEPETVAEPLQPAVPAETVTVPQTRSEDFLVIDDKIKNVDYRLAKCCSPVPGDEIFGFVTVSEGIKIHRINCPNARQLLQKYGYRVVKAHWKYPEGTGYFEAVIRITGIDELGVINKLTDVISRDLRVNMRSLSIDAKEGIYEGFVRVMVRDKIHLNELIHRLAKVKGVLTVSRVEGM